MFSGTTPVFRDRLPPGERGSPGVTHLRLAGKRLGLLINCNVVLNKDGITRIANGMPN